MNRGIFFIFSLLVLGMFAEGLAWSLYFLSPRPTESIHPSNQRFQDPKIPGIPYLYKAGQEFRAKGWTQKINSLGLREVLEPADLEKPENQSCEKILVIGSSFSMGYGVNSENSIPQQIEQNLNLKGPGCFRFINAGIEAYPMGSKLELLKYLVPLYRPNQVVLEMNSYDLDDPRKVFEDRLDFDPLKSVNHDWLRLKWTVSGKYLDLENAPYSMEGFVKLPRPEAPPAFPNFILPTLLRNYLRSKAEPDPAVNGCVSGQCLDLKPTFKNVPLVPFSALFFSPKYKSRFEKHLNEFSAYCKSQDLPLQVWNIDARAALGWTPQEPETRLIHWDHVLGMPFEKFRAKHPLPEDIHTNSQGNKILAEKLAPLFVDSSLVPKPSTDSQEYWQADQERHSVNEKLFSNKIDLFHRKGTHQILGGLSSDLFFPSSNPRAYFLMKAESCQKIKIWGQNQGAKNLELDIVATHGTFQQQSQVFARSSKWEGSFNCEDQSGWWDLQVTCSRPGCEKVQLWGLEIIGKN